MTVRELLGRLDSRELTEWMAYAMLDPFGEERADLRSALVACTVANAFRGRGSRRAKPKDFMPDFAKAAAGQSDAEMRASLVAWTVVLGGEVK